MAQKLQELSFGSRTRPAVVVHEIHDLHRHDRASVRRLDHARAHGGERRAEAAECGSSFPGNSRITVASFRPAAAYGYDGGRHGYVVRLGGSTIEGSRLRRPEQARQ